MDNSILKERAKINIGKKRGESIVVALIISFALGSISIPSVNFNFSVDVDSADSLLDGMMSDFPFNILSTAIIAVIAVTALVIVAKTVFLSPLAVGGYRYFLKIRKDENTGIGDCIGNFKDGNYLNVVLIMFLKDLFASLWMLLCFIPGIIKAFEYSMIPFILAVRPDIDRKEAFRLSKALTDTHKLDLFWLDITFIGWEILSLFTCGILGIVYVNPYIFATDAEAFAYLREDAITRGAIRPDELPIYGCDSPDYTPNPFGGFNGFEGEANGGFNDNFTNNNGDGSEM